MAEVLPVSKVDQFAAAVGCSFRAPFSPLNKQSQVDLKECGLSLLARMRQQLLDEVDRRHAETQAQAANSSPQQRYAVPDGLGASPCPTNFVARFFKKLLDDELRELEEDLSDTPHPGSKPQPAPRQKHKRYPWRQGQLL
eukprot:gene4337-6714_t